MRFSWRLILRIGLVAAAAVIFWIRLMPHGHSHPVTPTPAVTALSQTSPLNQPDGGPAPQDGYAVYSALYAAGSDEPLVFADRSQTDIPQVGGSCLKPKTAEERAMTEALRSTGAR